MKKSFIKISHQPRLIKWAVLLSFPLMGLLAFQFVATTPTALAAKKSKKEKEDQIDYIALAARLIADGHEDRAQQMLDQVDLLNEEVDVKQFYTLKGLVLLKQNNAEAAVKNFELAVKNGQTEPAIFLYLAQAYFILKNYQETIEYLKKSGPAAEAAPGAFGILAQAHWELKEPALALNALDSGIKKFTEDTSLLRVKIFYLVELGLFQEVIAMTEGYLTKAGIGASEYIAIAEALRRGSQQEKARLIMGQARLRFPENTQVIVQLAHTYVDDDRPLSAAMLFEDAARLDNKYFLEAAELYKQAGRPQLALTLNSQVVDQKEKLKQRLSLLLEAERFELVSGMDDSLSRLGLLEDDNVRYALAYAYYKLGDFGKAESELKRVKDASLFRAATQLRQAMNNCRDAGWECY